MSEFDAERGTRVANAVFDAGMDRRPWWLSYDFTTGAVTKVYGNG